MGAQFEVTDYAATGSGSPAVRGILYYENQWGEKPLQKLSEEEAITLALRALDTAAEADTSTGGVDRGGKIFPDHQGCLARRNHDAAGRKNRRRISENCRMIEEPYRWVEAIANRREYIETQLAPGGRLRPSVIVTAFCF